MAALKVLVIVLGLAILGMIALIGITVAKRFSGGGDKPVEATLGLPAGSTILQAVPADGQLAVTARLPDGTTRVTVIDLASGRTLATVRP